MASKNYCRLSLPIRARADAIYDAFIDPKLLSRFWLQRSSGPLQRGVPVTWDFKVPGASETTTADTLRPGERIAWHWSDGVKVRIDIERASRVASVVRIVAGPFASTTRAVDATEGFCLVLCDLKILLETGTSPGLVKDKAALIAR